MTTEKGLMTKVEVGHGNFLAPVPAIVGLLLGLVYVIALPGGYCPFSGYWLYSST